MIVDDDTFVRTTLAELLNREPGILVCATYSDGNEALGELATDRPQVMLVDVVMPGMDGPELTRLIRGHEPSVSVLALTSLTDESTVAAMLQAGALGFLFKDSGASAIADAIRAARSGLSVLSPAASRPLARAPESAPQLTELEHRVLELVGQGLTNEQIAKSVYLSASTVKYHIAALTEKLGATNRVTLAVRAGELHLL